MKTIADPAMDAIEAGEAIVTGAVEILGRGRVAWPEGASVDLDWWQNTFVQVGGNDEARMGIAFLDEAGTHIGATTWAAFTQPTTWTARNVSEAIPADAFTIRIYMEMQRLAGSNNDGDIDDIALAVDGDAITVVNPGAETGDTTGWTNELGAIDARTTGSGPASHSGGYYFHGGTSATTRAYQDFELFGFGGAPLRLWGGHGPISFDTDNGAQTFVGLGARALAQQNAGAVGGVAQGLTLTLSAVEPAALALLDADEIKGAAVVLYRLIFASDGKTLLDAHVFDRGRVDTVSTDETVGSDAAINLAVESAARGLGRSGARQRADSDQRLINSDDGYFKSTAYAGQKELYWGGKKPARVG